MGLDDKIGNAAEEAKGKAKEAAGKATDNESLEAKGQAEKTQGQPQAGRRGHQGRDQVVVDVADTP